MDPRRPLRLRITRACATAAASLGSMLICVLVSAGPAYGLDPNKQVSQYIHTSWRIQDGSLPAGMFSIAQTSDGFLWLVSLPGDVYRFDGVRFVRWPVPPGASGKVFADTAGDLWVASDEFVRLESGVVSAHFDLKGTHGYQSISGDPDGTVWVGLRGQDAPLCNVSDRGVKCFGKDEGVPLGDINAVVLDGSGGLWLGGSTALIHWRRGGVAETYPVKAPISSLAHTPDGTLWVGLFEEGPGLGLQELRDGVLKTFVTPHFDGSKVSVTSLMVDRDDNLWAGTDASGVVRIHGDAVERYRQTDGLSGDSVWALFEDREGIVWAGTTSGIDSFRDPRVVTFSAVQGLGKDLAAGILASRDGTVWVANNGSLDLIRNGTVTSIGRSKGLPGNQVAAMLEDRAGNLWVGIDDGLYLFKDGRFRRLPEPDHQPLGMVVGLTEDVDGNIWAACGRPRKLVRIRDFQVRDVFPADQVAQGAHHLAADPHGGIWIATSTGDVVLMRNGTVEATIPLDPRSSPLNRHIVADANGSVLVGSENGLVGWRAGTVQRMTTKNGLPCDFVIAFVQDTEKHWWLYTRCGVVGFSDAELQKWWANPEVLVQNRVYDAFDGAQPNIGSFNAAASTADGRVWFSSGVVVQMLDPSRISRAAGPAAASVESVRVDRETFAAVDNLEVGPHPRDLQIDYTSPTFSIPQKVTFRYTLDGYDDGWHEAGPRRQAFYTDVPPGKYTFRVMAANSDGVWNERAATLKFSIAPAYYQTNWFRALSAMFFVALLFSGFWVRLRALRQRTRKLEEMVSVRTRQLEQKAAEAAASERQAQDAHDKLRDAQDKIEQLLKAAPTPTGDLDAWCRVQAEALAASLNLPQVDMWLLEAGQLRPLTARSASMPDLSDLHRSAQDRSWLITRDGTVVPLVATSGALVGALVIASGAGGLDEAERRVLASFAHQVGAAVELHRTRLDLDEVRERRLAARAELSQQGVEVVHLCPQCGTCYGDGVGVCPRDRSPLSTEFAFPLQIASRYRLERLLGRGGSGVVFAAYDLDLDRRVAVKLLAGDGRLDREAWAVTRVQHPGVVAVYDAGALPGGSHYLVMERLSGHDLARTISASGPGRFTQVAALVEQGSLALAAAHREGLLHRDIKPSNVFLTTSEHSDGFRVKVVDFGIAQVAHATDSGQPGSLVGTPAYMSPEQIQGEALDARSDMYSFAAVCYKALTGRRTVGAERLHDLLLEVLLTPPPPASASRPDVSPSVDAALACALAKRPADRPSNLIDWAEALAADLRTLTAVVDVKGWDVHRVRDAVRGPVDTNAVTTLGDVDTRTRMSWE